MNLRTHVAGATEPVVKTSGKTSANYADLLARPPGRVVGLIPARTGSRGVPNKCFRPFPAPSGPSLTQRTARTAVKAGLDEVVISTDATGIWFERLRGLGATLLSRPADLAADDTPIKPVVEHTVDTLVLGPADRIVLLYPVYPLRTPSDVLLAAQQPWRSVIGRAEVDCHPELMRWKGGEPVVPHASPELEPYQRQQYRPCYRLTHFVCSFIVAELPELGPQLWGPQTVPVPVASGRILDIDDWGDWRRAEAILAHGSGLREAAQ